MRQAEKSGAARQQLAVSRHRLVAVATVGVIAIQCRAVTFRRLVASASVFPNAEKASMAGHVLAKPSSQHGRRAVENPEPPKAAWPYRREGAPLDSDLQVNHQSSSAMRLAARNPSNRS